MKTQEVSIYNDSAREYFKWARTQSDYTVGLINISKGVAIDTGIKLSRAQILEMSVKVDKLQSGNLAANLNCQLGIVLKFMNNPFSRYFTFWFSTFANGGEPKSIKLSDKKFYIQTKSVAIKHGPIKEDFGLKDKFQKIFHEILSIQK